ncbi:MAG TPA: Re/Si-specific NAD(P)(+) transhydrogenase subunit alpha [Alphaproteobacteria bacterium]|nr:Re/Si-specific NAD(P)(+) transhydrogenase subunit alpha [Alphaproteobacteria bacterium]
MALKIAITKETAAAEKRVAATPDTVKKLCALGCSIVIEAGAGKSANYLDADYETVGAVISKTAETATKDADIVLRVQANDKNIIKHLKDNCLLIGLINPYNNKNLIEEFAQKKVNSFSMELVPRISRAQSMDVLSSQSNLAGYKSVLDATEYFDRAMPMMMTAAGTVAPAKVFVMGAGVAGLQAIATARRLGAVVSATDVRPAAKEQVKSLGASFIAVEDDEFKEAESAGGYAKEMSKEYQAKQAALVEETIAKQDIVITTALIPGRPAPKLITEKMISSMKTGSVIVDMAVEAGGNVEGSIVDQVVEKYGVTIIGHANIASRLATDASALYAKNILSLLTLIIKDGDLQIDWEDDIIKGIALTKDGQVIHPSFIAKKD